MSDQLPLDIYLEEFKNAMRDKFFLRRDKALRRWGTSVTDPNFDWSNLNALSVEKHMKEEMDEWLEDDGENRIIEDVDIANMGFLDWMARRHK